MDSFTMDVIQLIKTSICLNKRAVGIGSSEQHLGDDDNMTFLTRLGGMRSNSVMVQELQEGTQFSATVDLVVESKKLPEDKCHTNHTGFLWV